MASLGISRYCEPLSIKNSRVSLLFSIKTLNSFWLLIDKVILPICASSPKMNERVEETHGPQFKKYNKLQSLRTAVPKSSKKACSKNTTNYNP